MSLIVLEGLDRTGKSTIAKLFEQEGYEVIHMSAPSKKYLEPGYTGPSYLDEMMDLIQMAASRDICLDRSHYGELVWPVVYGRKSMLSDEDIVILREMEESVGVRRILMHDPDQEAHWQRCVDNKEPMNRPQFLRARNMYDRMASKYNFERLVLTDIPDFKLEDEHESNDSSDSKKSDNSTTSTVASKATHITISADSKTKEQRILEKANAINEVLSKRIVKGKGQIFDEIESEVRNFLNIKLGTILGSEDKQELSKEEIHILKSFVKRIKDKGTE